MEKSRFWAERVSVFWWPGRWIYPGGVCLKVRKDPGANYQHIFTSHGNVKEKTGRGRNLWKLRIFWRTTRGYFSPCFYFSRFPQRLSKPNASVLSKWKAGSLTSACVRNPGMHQTEQQSGTTQERKRVRGRQVDCVIKSNYEAAVSFNAAHSRLFSLPFTHSTWGMETHTLLERRITSKFSPLLLLVFRLSGFREWHRCASTPCWRRFVKTDAPERSWV